MTTEVNPGNQYSNVDGKRAKGDPNGIHSERKQAWRKKTQESQRAGR